MAHPQIKEAAVIGVTDDKWGERPLACVVLEEGAELSRRRSSTSSATRSPSGSSPTASSSSRKCPRRPSASSPRRPCASASPPPDPASRGECVEGCVRGPARDGRMHRETRPPRSGSRSTVAADAPAPAAAPRRAGGARHRHRRGALHERAQPGSTHVRSDLRRSRWPQLVSCGQRIDRVVVVRTRPEAMPGSVAARRCGRSGASGSARRARARTCRSCDACAPGRCRRCPRAAVSRWRHAVARAAGSSSPRRRAGPHPASSCQRPRIGSHGVGEPGQRYASQPVGGADVTPSLVDVETPNVLSSQRMGNRIARAQLGSARRPSARSRTACSKPPAAAARSGASPRSRSRTSPPSRACRGRRSTACSRAARTSCSRRCGCASWRTSSPSCARRSKAADSLEDLLVRTVVAATVSCAPTTTSP